MPVPNRILGDEQISIFFQGDKLAHFDIRDLYKRIRAPEYMDYWSDKHDIPPNLIDNIDWESQGIAWRAQPQVAADGWSNISQVTVQWEKWNSAAGTKTTANALAVKLR